MNYFQFNYTTYAQSKRLLELGMPYKTADVYSIYDYKDVNRMIYAPHVYLGNQFFPSIHTDDQTFPIWSGLRLVELYELCFDEQAARKKGVSAVEWNFSDNDYESNIDYIIDIIDDYHKSGLLDFSRLNDWMNR
jgi:hypothetical protein